MRRSAATSEQNLAMAASSISPSWVVIDDEPTLATTIIGRRLGVAGSRSSSGLLVVLVVEDERPDAHRVAGPGPGARQCAVHAEAVEPAVRLGEGLGPREVGQRHRTNGLPALDDPSLPLAPHLVAGPDGAVDDELARRRQCGAGAADGV